MSSQLPFDEQYSQYFAGFQSFRGCKVFLLQSSEDSRFIKKCCRSRRVKRKSAYTDQNRYKVEQHLFGFTMCLPAVATVTLGFKTNVTCSTLYSQDIQTSYQ